MGFGLKWEYVDVYKDKKVRVDKKLFLPAAKDKFLTCAPRNHKGMLNMITHQLLIHSIIQGRINIGA